MQSDRAATNAMVASLCAVFMIGNIYRYSIAVVAPELQADLGLSPEILGGLSAAMFFSFAVMQIPVGILVDRFGARRTIISMQGLAMVGPIIFATAEDAVGLYLGAALMGVGASSNLMAPLVVYSRWFPADRFATITSITIAVGGIGQITSTLPVALFAETFGWRQTYFGISGLVALVAVFAVLLVRDSPPGVRPASASAVPPERLRDTIRGMREVVAVAGLGRLIVMTAFGSSILFTVRTLWAGPYLNDVFDLDPGGRGNILLIMSIAMIAGTLFYGPLDRRFDTRKGVVIVGGLATFAALGTLAILPGPPLWLAATLLGLFGFLGLYDIPLMAHGRALFSQRLAGRGITTINTFHFGGTATLQVMTGFIIGAIPTVDGVPPEEAYRLVFGILATLGLLALLVYRGTTDARPSQGFPGSN